MVGKKIVVFLKKNLPTILSSLAGIGVVVTTIFAVKDTKKRIESGHEDDKKIFTIIKDYYRTIISASLTIVSMISSNIISEKQKQSILSAYVLLQNSYKAFEKKVVEKIGEEAFQDIKKEIIEDGFKREYKESITRHECADASLFYDEISDRYFWMPMEDLVKAEQRFNDYLERNGQASVNDLYCFCDLDPIWGGDEIGWIVDYNCGSRLYFGHIVVENDTDSWYLYEPDRPDFYRWVTEPPE